VNEAEMFSDLRLTHARIKWRSDHQSIDASSLGCQGMFDHTSGRHIDGTGQHRHLAGNGPNGDIKHDGALLIGQKCHFAG
jgi:hypothetical protein